MVRRLTDTVPVRPSKPCRKWQNRRWRCVTPEGQRAVTHFERVGGNDSHALLKFALETGRTHQIRVHMAYIGFPLCGDEMYGGDMSGIKRHALHCGEVIFTQPVTKEIIRLTSPLPADMSELIK